jgi:hypothetical protein
MTIITRFRSIGLLLFLAALALTPAFATDVTYTTTGSFASSGTNTYTGSMGLQIVFTGTPADFPNVSVPNISYAPFGTFTATGPALNSTDTVSDDFTLQITQIAPAPGGTETLVDSVSGSIKIANSQVTVTFNQGNGAGGLAVAAIDPLDGAAALRFAFGDVTYWVDDVTPIHPQTGSGLAGTSIINGAIDLPEPAFYSLTGAGFAGLVAMAMRRRRQAAGQRPNIVAVG